MKKSLIVILAVTLGIGLLLGDLTIVNAQEEFTLEEITVTAQKREENQQKVPIAMEVISGDQMKELGQTSIYDILDSIGTAILNKQSDGFHVTIRGISDDSAPHSDLTTAAPTVAVTTDGVFSTRNDRGIDLYDLERVEVLFGPQSTLYAANSPGGVINIITASPKIDTYEVSGLLEYGNFDLLHMEGTLNVPLGERVALRTSFYSSNHDGYISNGGDDEDKRSARVKTLFQANENLSFTITANLEKTGDKGGHAAVEGFIDQDDVDDPWYSTEELRDSNEGKAENYDGRMDWESGIGTLTVIGSYSDSTRDSLQSDQVWEGVSQTAIFHQDQTEKGTEARMVSSSDFFIKWIAGANWYVSENFRTTERSETATSQYNAIDQETDALYANVTYPVIDVFRVTGGVRRTNYNISSTEADINTTRARQGAGMTVVENPDGTYNCTEEIENDYTGTDYKLGVEYDLGTNSMLYAEFATSFRLQGKSNYGPGWKLAPPEKLKAYTIGMKNRFFGNKLQVNSSAYYYDYKDKRPQGDARACESYFYEDEVWQDYGDGNGLVNIDINEDGEITHELYQLRDDWTSQWGDYVSAGVDIQSSWIITNKDKLNLTLSYLYNKWTDLVIQSYYSYAYPDMDLTGKRATNAPKYNMSLAYDHTFNLMNGGLLNTRIDGRYQSSYLVTYRDYDYPYNYQEAHHIFDFSTVYSNPDGKWTLTGYVKNIENYAVKLSYTVSRPREGEYVVERMQIGSPRTYGLVLSVKY